MRPPNDQQISKHVTSSISEHTEVVDSWDAILNHHVRLVECWITFGGLMVLNNIYPGVTMAMSKIDKTP